MSKSKKIDYDSSEESMDEDEVSQISQNSKQNMVTSEFKEKVITYIKIDDLIRKKNEEIKELKEKKKPCEEFIIGVLEKVEAEFVDYNGGKLVKTKSETKTPLKPELIKDAIYEGLMREKIVKDKESSDKILVEIFDLIEKKREKKVKVNIRRTFDRKSNKKKD
jgi:hypothetical protein